MGILLLVIVLVVGVVLGYVAASFDFPITRKVGPLLERAVQDISARTDAASDKTDRRIEGIGASLARDLSRAAVGFKEAAAELENRISEVDRSIAAAVADLSEAVQRIGAIQTESDRSLLELGKDLAETGGRVAQLAESLARQGTLLTAIYAYAKGQGKLAETSGEVDQLLLAMLAAESHVDGMGWGTPPRLFALTERMPLGPADLEDSAGTPDALILVPHGLPDGDLADALAVTHMPEEVVGCVLVAELTDLPARGEDDAPIDPVAAGQWASARPDGRPARLAVGVCRAGEHVCGFRVKGEHDVQVRADIAAADIVTALLRTF